MTRTGELQSAPATRVPARTWPAVALVFLGSGLALYLLCARFPVLPDGDSYYHLAVARAYAEHGLSYPPDWAPFSNMHDGFGDKEVLFHVLLMPFARLADPTRGGVVALALLGALVAAVLAHQATAAIGRWGLAVPLLVFGGAADFMLRAIRLRPELLSLLLILLAIPLASRRRPVLLGVLACLYALCYTAFQAFLGLCVLFFLCSLWVERRAEWRLLVYPAIGVALGLLLHPQFPANLRVWLVQNVGFFVGNETVDLGPEILPRTTRDTLLLNLGWWAGLVVLWRSRSPIVAPGEDRRLRDFTLLAAAAFGLLYLFMYRFIVYAVPLATLAVLRSMQAAGEAPGRFVRLPGRGRVPFALVLALSRLRRAPGAARPRPDADGDGAHLASGHAGRLGGVRAGHARRREGRGTVGRHRDVRLLGAAGRLPERARPALHGCPGCRDVPALPGPVRGPRAGRPAPRGRALRQRVLCRRRPVSLRPGAAGGRPTGRAPPRRYHLPLPVPRGTQRGLPPRLEGAPRGRADAAPARPGRRPGGPALPARRDGARARRRGLRRRPTPRRRRRMHRLRARRGRGSPDPPRARGLALR